MRKQLSYWRARSEPGQVHTIEALDALAGLGAVFEPLLKRRSLPPTTDDDGLSFGSESVVFKVYSDGSGMTGGPAGIGFVAYADGELLLKGNRAVASATNHQAELRAAVFALDSIPEGQDVQLLSDSKYLIDGYNTYLPKWRERGWPDSGVGSVVNSALWKQLIVAAERHRDVRFRWTKGHDGTEGNEHAHQLATQARRVAEGVEWLDVVPAEEPPTLA